MPRGASCAATLSIITCQVGYLEVFVDNGLVMVDYSVKKVGKNKVAMVVLIRNVPGREVAVEGMEWIDPERGERNKKIKLQEKGADHY